MDCMSLVANKAMGWDLYICRMKRCEGEKGEEVLGIPGDKPAKAWKYRRCDEGVESVQYQIDGRKRR